MPPDEMKTGTDEQQKFQKNWEEVCMAVHDALARLNFIAGAVKKASAQQPDRTVATLTDNDDAIFRDQIVLWVRHRRPAARKELCQQLGDSIVVRRPMILQRNLHSNRVAKRRERDETQVKEDAKPYLAAGLGSPLVVKQRCPTAGQSLGGGTMASRPDPKNRMMTSLLRVPEMHALPHAPTTAISTISTRQDDSLEYPPAPVASKGATSAQCPYCLRGLELREDDKVSDHVWRRHVDEHVQPYPCLFPECAESLVFFSRPHDSKTHMESAHSEEWMRKVHTVVWCCNLKHKSSDPVQLETELEWRKHCQDLDLHPDKSKPPSEAQLDSSSPRSQRVAKREQFVCPLCEQIPDKIKPLLDKKDTKDIHGTVVDHVAAYLRSLSLMAVPSFENGNQQSPGSESEDVDEESSNRSLNDQPPSGREEIVGVSLPTGSDFGNYKPPDEPQSLVYDEMFERWNAWRSEHNYFPSAPENDPILMHFKDVQGVGKVHAGWFDVDDWKSLSERTQLSFAAETGNRATVEEPLDKGANLELADQDRQTPLLWAADSGNEETTRLLLERGARIEASDQVSEADFDAADNSHRTPISWASAGGHDETVKLLARRGANFELPEPKYGRTPLLWAAVKGHEGVVKLLLDLGVGVDTVDQKSRRSAVVELLLSHGANVEAADPESNQTPISLAAENGSEETVKVLLAHKTDFEAKDHQGWTALKWASDKDHESVVRLLRSHGAKDS
ncbi:hypothetical protein CSOJ01_06291 [Colletotrichum sojae]|uniref:C2H2-type domain-containing protein n=1 Tax=Colletotrichum sojae TaxID=2175907 RepID=A0A8H6JC94_9PEZI|nr:hypothetical protein CSOJ01_06291 [Colletotrichum sojae]